MFGPREPSSPLIYCQLSCFKIVKPMLHSALQRLFVFTSTRALFLSLFPFFFASGRPRRARRPVFRRCRPGPAFQNKNVRTFNGAPGPKGGSDDTIFTGPAPSDKMRKGVGASGGPTFLNILQPTFLALTLDKRRCFFFLLLLPFFAPKRLAFVGYFIFACRLIAKNKREVFSEQRGNQVIVLIYRDRFIYWEKFGFVDEEFFCGRSPSRLEI